MNDINIDEFEDFDDESDIDSSDCDTSDDVSSENDDTFEYVTTDAEDLTTTDDDEESDGEEFGKLLIVHPPEVLEPSIIINRCPGIPDLMKHRGYRLCGDNIDKNVHARHM